LISLVEILQKTETWFRDRGIDSPRLEAELILAHVLQMNRVALYLNYDRPLTEEELATSRALVARRGKREPLAWILGQKAFHEIDLVVHPGVFVPRADTETLVNAALEWFTEREQPLYVADVCCGTGAVGLTLAHLRENIRLFSVDLSPEALANTRENVQRLALSERVAVLSSSLLDKVPAHRPIHWVVSNPPYIPTSDIQQLMPEVSQFEPRLALDGGTDGLDVYRKLISHTVRRASRGILMEIGVHQAPAVMDLCRRAKLVDITSWKDLNGISRVIGAKKQL
jgi:release factor glutamine methyltransferase